MGKKLKFSIFDRTERKRSNPFFDKLSKERPDPNSLETLLNPESSLAKPLSIGVIGSGATGSEIATGFNDLDYITSVKVATHSEESAEVFRNSYSDILHDGKIEISPNYTVLNNSDIIFITVADSTLDDRNFTSRSQLLSRNMKYWVQMEENLKLLSNQNALLVVVTNPTDIATTLIRGELNYPEDKVIGFSGLDQLRTRAIIAEMYNTQLGIKKIKPQDVHAYTMGSHGGKSMCFAWSDFHVNTDEGKIRFNDLPFENIRPSEMKINGSPLNLEHFPKEDAIKMQEIIENYSRWDHEDQIDGVKRYIALTVTREGRRVINETGTNPKGIFKGAHRFTQRIMNQEQTVQGAYFGKINSFGVDYLNGMTNGILKIGRNEAGFFIEEKKHINAEQVSNQEYNYMTQALKGNQRMGEKVMNSYHATKKGMAK